MIPYSKAKTAGMSNTGGGISQIMRGATPTTDGEAGAVPKPLAGQDSLFLRGDGTWAAAQGERGTGITDITENADYSLTISLSDGSSYDTDPVKGEKGDKGDTGEQGIQGIQGVTGATPNVTANGTITGDTGTPTVNVSRSGTNENPVLSFTFNNIKGAKGDTGNGIVSIVKTSSSHGVDTYTITLDDGNTATFTVTNGTYTEIVTRGTLLASGWVNNTYSFENDYPMSDYNIEIEPDGDRINTLQYDTWGNAKMVGSSTSNSCIAIGVVPTIDIPIIIKAAVLG